MALFDSKKQLKTELFFRDNRNFIFKKHELYNSCLVERGPENVLTRAVKHFFSCEIPFPGYKNIPADMVVLGFSRDIILDPFNKVPQGTEVNTKPNPKEKDSVKKWIAKIAENQRHIYRAKRETHVWTNRLTWVFIVIIIFELLIWALAFLRGVYAD